MERSGMKQSAQFLAGFLLELGRLLRRASSQ